MYVSVDEELLTPIESHLDPEGTESVPRDLFEDIERYIRKKLERDLEDCKLTSAWIKLKKKTEQHNRLKEGFEMIGVKS